MTNKKLDFVRLRDELSGELDSTKYKIILEEPDTEDPDLIWIYLESEYSDENVEYEPTYNFYYAKITNNYEGLIV